MRGFTLIELMIVIAIITILAAIALPAYRDFVSRSKISNAVAGLAGEKIKVAQNISAGKVGDALCDEVATNGATCTQGILSVGGTGAASADTSVQLTPWLMVSAGDRIIWSCTVLLSPSANYVGDDCANLAL